MTHLILEASELDHWEPHPSGARLIHANRRPTMLQPDRDTAEREALRLARAHPQGLFVLFAPVAMAKRVPEATHVNLRGEVIRHAGVVRLLVIGDQIPF